MQYRTQRILENVSWLGLSLGTSGLGTVWVATAQHYGFPEVASLVLKHALGCLGGLAMLVAAALVVREKPVSLRDVLPSLGLWSNLSCGCMSAMALAALAKGISKEFSFLLWIAAIALHTMILLAATFFCVVLPWTRPKQWLYTEQRSGSSNSLYGSTESTDRQDCESNSTIPCAATLLSRRLFTPGIFPITVGIGMGAVTHQSISMPGMDAIVLTVAEVTYWASLVWVLLLAAPVLWWMRRQWAHGTAGDAVPVVCVQAAPWSVCLVGWLCLGRVSAPVWMTAMQSVFGILSLGAVGMFARPLYRMTYSPAWVLNLAMCYD
eukprot:m.678013 g.678013  ORF g.678013 m.678013 type:complete len:322 (-) comp22803_c0_seq16:259-1224(-)